MLSRKPGPNPRQATVAQQRTERVEKHTYIIRTKTVIQAGQLLTPQTSPGTPSSHLTDLEPFTPVD